MRRVTVCQVSADSAVALSAVGVQVSIIQSREYRLSVASSFATPWKVSLACNAINPTKVVPLCSALQHSQSQRALCMPACDGSHLPQAVEYGEGGLWQCHLVTNKTVQIYSEK